jgi:hypothetical protein
MRQVSWLSTLPEPSHPPKSGQWHFGFQASDLVDYSCGDSSGLSPEFPFNLPFRNEELKEPTSIANLDENVESEKRNCTKKTGS